MNNRIMVVKLSNIHKMDDKDDDRSDEESDDDADDEAGDETKPDRDPNLEIALISHKGCINRIRISSVQGVPLAATWSETGKVNIWDLTVPLMAVDDPEYMKKYVKNKESPRPSFIFPGHQDEGYAMDWSTTVPGRLATGDCKRNIHLWSPQDDGTWTVDRRPYLAHTDSVEDIQWSPNEDNVFASCSVDKSVRVWDSRAPPLKACMLTAADAHDSDVNVISWNRHEPFIVSGGDDGAIKVWDLREFTKGKPVAVFKYHAGPITSIEWHPQDSTVFAAASGDNQLTQWDIAAEQDDEGGDAAAAGGSSDAANLPPQLLFVHQGQVDIKELHWHPQIPGTVISTALNGFDIFRTISV
jgi:ribosome assembly protein RRB1